MATGSVGLALLAGVLSSLSPCVLPLLPIVLGTALSEHRLGPVAIAGGLAASFATVGLFIATIGFSIGLDAEVFRFVAAAMLLAIGVILLVPKVQARLAAAAGPMSNWTERQFGGFRTSGIRGQFAVGLLLGIIWAPCVGPTLGAASLMAASGENLGEVALVMFAFGIGAGLLLVALGMLSRHALTRWRDRMLKAGKWGKAALGTLLVIVGMLIVTGLDRRVETLLVEASPKWLTDLTTRF